MDNIPELQLLVTALCSLCVGGICGLVIMYRQVGELKSSLDALRDALSGFVERTEDDRREASRDRERIHIRIDALAKRNGC